jgi:hypothetical protein
LDNDNNNLLWFASNPIMRQVPMDVSPTVRATYPDDQEFYEHVPVEVGDQIDLKATIKEHKTDTFNDRNRKQTVITRGKLIE